MSARGASRATICPRARRSREILQSVLDLMYPGYFGRRDLSRENLGDYVAQALGELAPEDRARDGALSLLRARARGARSEFGECAPRAHELTEVFLQPPARDPRASGARRAGRLRRRSGRHEPGRGDSRLSRRARRQRLSHRACALRSRRAHDGAHHDRVGAFEDRLRHSSGRQNRRRLLHRSRHRRGDRRDHGNRRGREALPGRHLGRAVAAQGCQRGTSSAAASATPRSRMARRYTRTRPCSAVRRWSARRASSAARCS